MQQKKIPMRRCVGCNESKPKKELVRIVRSPEGEIGMDLTGKKSGRGAYICRNPLCLQKAQKSARLEKALDCKLSEAVWQQLAAFIADASGVESQNG